MKLTTDQLERYEVEGLLLVSESFEAAEAAALQREVRRLLAEDSAGRVFERDGVTVRAVHGCHRTSELCGRLVRHPRLLEPVRQILGDDVYVHQFKVNAKAAFCGDVWPWHQDFIFWHQLDGVPEPRLVNAAVFVDDVHEFNGPPYFALGSHLHGMIDVPARQEADGREAWQSSFAADLRYSLDPSWIARTVDVEDLVAPKGRAGTVLFFHPDLIHGSVPNISPFDRTLIVVTYNSVTNTPRPVAERRPEFLIGRDFTPLAPLADRSLIGSTA